MIKSWRHQGLKNFFEHGDLSRIQTDHAKKLKVILQRLNAAISPEDMNTPEMKFHRLKGALNDYYAVKVNKNWRVIFTFKQQNAFLVDYKDYH